jgi:hypothetical protein
LYCTLAAFLIARVLTDVADEKIEQPVAVVIEEDGARRMGGKTDAGIFGDVTKMAAAVVENGLRLARL